METTVLDIAPGKDIKKEFLVLYEELFPLAATYVQQRGGSYEQAKDIFQDSLIIYYERAVLDSAAIENVEAYITQVVKHLWFRRYKESKRWSDFEDVEEQIAASVDDYNQPVSWKLLRFVELAGRKCMSLLKAFYYQKASMEEIAEEYGFSGIRSATVQKYKCLEKLRDEVKNKKMSYADFIE